MGQDNFNEGYLFYECGLKTMDELRKDFDFKNWSDGCLAFSNTEKRLDEVSSTIVDLIKGDEKGKVTGIEGINGYLMEIDLWRKVDDRHEEICIEREDNGYYYQSWKLMKQPPTQEHYYACYYRYVETLPRYNSLFKNNPLKSAEVIIPQNRFHFFITVGGDK